ncbi:hypothetical protein A2962_04270 [Candidatus Woesebacteria bacterium RIFCSPLOWO2_01_FULL_39_61]|uniref:Uncharacterized protein n=1 Tax=Candidatus Woesebacteria bacterium RIFCSPHIGHO2_02_FULL_39_13 TaxID=1802505 RepID=A0A1F7YY21_9BACT|nr:MAG: hypothetical protein A2692_05165 [Candidatus Woesebacteria bacterium RIFCSPHIGHO2_01_FULL_39_95]OGM32177.1 MAG: hypothetical protein A3D01_02210 [Candidatus Woesebacteria bacterium RIFCSPHIGHO2_02_FULL_39_13]OGM36528.1 MAG: hypothetical protein A3E13_04225 [Candidatus Woesebacteria bacterium RIFCSPHIGHO2_12_FULL_40_20]OGM65967.1 MAG: hypothetical protein A2962_04270 [Candidatus Woesebacteria bacterium RIFCSPLOWO2_01_FULL_39_61]OGM71981.1 MAG: hypothetical protein A3H19_01015 [Candidatus
MVLPIYLHRRAEEISVANQVEEATNVSANLAAALKEGRDEEIQASVPFVQKLLTDSETIDGSRVHIVGVEKEGGNKVLITEKDPEIYRFTNEPVKEVVLSNSSVEGVFQLVVDVVSETLRQNGGEVIGSGVSFDYEELGKMVGDLESYGYKTEVRDLEGNAPEYAIQFIDKENISSPIEEGG